MLAGETPQISRQYQVYAITRYMVRTSAVLSRSSVCSSWKKTRTIIMNWAIKNPSFSRKVCTPDVNYMEMLEIMADWGKPKVKLTHASSRKQLAMVSISSIDLLGVMDRRFSLHTWNYSWRIWRHQRSDLIACSGTATLPVSYRQMVWNASFLCM